MEGLGRLSTRLALGFGPCGTLGKQRQFGNPQELRKSPAALVPWSHQSGGLSPGSDCLVLGQSSWQSRQNGMYRALGRPSDVLGWRVWGMTDP